MLSNTPERIKGLKPSSTPQDRIDDLTFQSLLVLRSNIPSTLSPDLVASLSNPEKIAPVLSQLMAQLYRVDSRITPEDTNQLTASTIVNSPNVLAGAEKLLQLDTLNPDPKIRQSKEYRQVEEAIIANILGLDIKYVQSLRDKEGVLPHITSSAAGFFGIDTQRDLPLNLLQDKKSLTYTETTANLGYQNANFIPFVNGAVFEFIKNGASWPIAGLLSTIIFGSINKLANSLINGKESRLEQGTLKFKVQNIIVRGIPILISTWAGIIGPMALATEANKDFYYNQKIEEAQQRVGQIITKAEEQKLYTVSDNGQVIYLDQQLGPLQYAYDQSQQEQLDKKAEIETSTRAKEDLIKNNGSPDQIASFEASRSQLYSHQNGGPGVKESISARVARTKSKLDEVRTNDVKYQRYLEFKTAVELAKTGDKFKFLTDKTITNAVFGQVQAQTVRPHLRTSDKLIEAAYLCRTGIVPGTQARGE